MIAVKDGSAGMPENTQRNFWKKVRKTDSCWIWVASTGRRGHGTFSVAGKIKKAHRISWELHNGAIPHGLWVLHRCDKPGCVKPEHLYLGVVGGNLRINTRSKEFVAIFESKQIDGPGGCRIWNGGKFKDGYGNTWLDGKAVKAHRAAYILRFGSIPKGLLLLHKCNTRACVRIDPDHVYVGNQAQNMRDKVESGRQARLRGESGGNSKLRNEHVLLIRKLSEAGHTQKFIAVEFGIHPGTVGKIVRRDTWGHLPTQARGG